MAFSLDSQIFLYMLILFWSTSSVKPYTEWTTHTVYHLTHKDPAVML